MTDIKTMKDVAAFRAWAYSVKPEFGVEIDKLIVEGTGFGGLSDVLSSISRGLESAAQTAELSYQRYIEAQYRTADIRNAAAAGVSVDEYRRITAAGNSAALIAAQGRETIGAGITDPSNSTILGVPTWVFVAGAAFLLLYKKL